MKAARALYMAWRAVLSEHNHGAEYDAREQAAYDALIEHLEANGLNHCSYDPRH